MLILEDSIIRNLAGNAGLVSEFPFLGAAKNANAACRCQQANIDYNQIRISIAGMSEAEKARFKVLTGADVVRVFYRTGSKIQAVEF